MKLQREEQDRYGLKVYEFSTILTLYIKLEVEMLETQTAMSPPCTMQCLIYKRNMARSVFRSHYEENAVAKRRGWDTYAKINESSFVTRPPTVTEVPTLAEVEEVVASNSKKL